MFDFEYRPENGGFMSRTAYIATKKAENSSDEELDNLSDIVAEQGEAVAENFAAIKNEAAARKEADVQEASIREAADEKLNEKINNIPQADIDLSDYIERDEFENALGGKADLSDVYSMAEADAKFLIEHQDISDLVTKDELADAVAPFVEMASVEELVNQEASSREEAINEIKSSFESISGIVENLSYEFDSVDEKLAGLAEVNLEQDTRIAALVSEYKKLKELIGDLGGDVEYDVPGDGKLVDMLKKSGTVKLMEDTESATYTGGLTSKNVTTLNTNGKTVTFTGTTVNNPGIMTRGSEQLTIVGKGKIDAAGRIAIESNGTNSIINLSGSTGFFGAEPTYVTDRSGGELIYCYLGTINIYAGIFMNNGENKGFTLNCYDANYKNGKAVINVMGGKFYDFDPANNKAEGEGTSFVPEGYESIHTTEEIDGVTHDVYTVKKTA